MTRAGIDNQEEIYLCDELNNAEVNAMQDKVYWANQVATILDVSKSTLRKWSLALEAAGYVFVRDEHDRRCYIERDIPVLRRMKTMLDDGMTMENAALVGIALEKPRENEVMSGSVNMVVHAQNMRLEDRYLEIVAQNQKMRAILERLEERMQEQQENMRQQLAVQRQYIEESLHRRDEQLMLTLREMTEARKEAAATKKWWRFWEAKQR
nr:MerR family transcriptional regulator [Paenibacillus popilliae]